MDVVLFLSVFCEMKNYKMSLSAIRTYIFRTGTFFTVHIIITQLRQYYANYVPTGNKIKAPEINIIETILKLREQRSGFVQTKV